MMMQRIARLTSTRYILKLQQQRLQHNSYGQFSSNLTPNWQSRWLSTTTGGPRQRVKTFTRIQRENSLGRLTPSEAAEKFRTWRRKHTLWFVAIGGIGGAGVMSAALYLYLEHNPSAMEKLVVNKTVGAFSQALSFERRKAIYFGLPEPSFPLPVPGSSSMSMLGVGGGSSDSDEDGVLNLWGEVVTKAIKQTESPWMLATTSLREQLLDEIRSLDSLQERLENLAQVLPPSVERNIMVEEELSKELAINGTVTSELLDTCMPQFPAEAQGMVTRLLIAAIAYFPGPANQMIAMLFGKISPHQLTSNLSNMMKEMKDANAAIETAESTTPKIQSNKQNDEEDTGDSETMHRIELALSAIKDGFDKLHPLMKEHVLQTALSTTISQLPNLDMVLGSVRPYDLYVKAIEDDLLGPLRRDAQISEDILDQVKQIFLALPSDLQARVLLTAIGHPDASGDATPEQQAEVVRDLLSAGGVVAVKLAQMIAEDPRVPENYRTLLGGLRDDNKPMGLADFWWRVPGTVRKMITSLGPCLGTGSVKQVHQATFANGMVNAVAVLRSQVEDEALASLTALEVSDELGVIASRLGKLVYNEFSLFGEGEVLSEFAMTPIGQHPRFKVVKVRHHSPKCLVEEIAKGRPIVDVLEHGDAEEVEELKEILAEYHKVVFEAFVNDGLIHSDIHLGNAVVSFHEDSNLKGFTLYDVGQFERVGFVESKSLLWLLASLSSQKMQRVVRPTAINNLTQAVALIPEYRKSEYRYNSKEQPNDDEKKVKYLRLDDAFTEATEPFADGTLPNPKEAYMLFLRASERRGLILPKGAFALAKMVDGIVSQQRSYNLKTVLDDSMEQFLKKNMTWTEAVNILYSNVQDNIHGHKATPPVTVKVIQPSGEQTKQTDK